MEEYLNDRKDEDSYHFEAMNFGMGWYTSAHSVINFVLNVIDFSPDYVILHDGWNEGFVRNVPASEFRGDYAHALTYFHEPYIVDKYPIRVSVLYRYVKQRLTAEPDWVFLDTAILKKIKRTELEWKNLNELNPYRRNIKTIVDLANLRGIRVVLSTQPHSTDPQVLSKYDGAVHMDQANNIVREVYKEYQDNVLFVDLDVLMTGKMNKVFEDLGHMDVDGTKFQAEQFGKVILEHWKKFNSSSEQRNKLGR